MQSGLAGAAPSGSSSSSSSSRRGVDPLHNRVDDLAQAYSNFDDNSSADAQTRQASQLLSIAEGYLNDENPREALKAAREALSFFQTAGNKNAVHDALRVVVNGLRMEADNAYASHPAEAEALVEEELRKFRAAGDRRGEAAMLLSKAECLCDRRRIRPSQMEDAFNWAHEALSRFREIDDKKMMAIALLEIAHISSLKEEADDVFEAASEARSCFQAVQDKKGDARALHGVAIASVLQRRFPEALGKMKEALALFKDLGLRKFEAFELCVMAEVHLEDEKPLRALPVARQALSLFREIEYGKGWEAASLLAVTRSLTEKGQGKQALQAAKEGVERFRRIGDKRQQVFGHQILADAHLNSQHFDEALDEVDAALLLSKDLSDKKLELDTLHMSMWCHIGNKEWDKAIDAMEDGLNLTQDDSKGALEKVEEAKTLFAKAEDRKGEASSCLIASSCHSAQCELDQALDEANNARELFRDVRDSRGEGNACSLLAELHLAKDRPELALQMAERRVELMQDFASKKAEAGALHQLAHIHLECESYVKAEQHAMESKKLAVAVHDRKAETEAQLLLTQVYIATNADMEVPEKGAHPMEKALRAASEAVSSASKSGDRPLQANARYWRAYLLAQTGRLPDALRASGEAREFFRKAGDGRGEATSLLLQGNISHTLGQVREAKGFVEQALDIASVLGDSQLEDDAAKLLDRIEGKGQAVPVAAAALPQEQVADAAAAAPTPAAAAAPVESVAEQPKGLDPTYVRTQLMAFVKDVMATDDELELDTPFMEAGMDSLSSVSLMSMVAKEFQMALSPSLVFDFPTVRALEEHLVQESQGG
mmetsp:Transcript_29209/g.63383  ORF Transcript_29209/g.63383 Transcript_29209/m.63383 type:complete len:830 (+) Transcript_29209:200-2689(+)